MLVYLAYFGPPVIIALDYVGGILELWTPPRPPTSLSASNVLLVLLFWSVTIALARANQLLRKGALILRPENLLSWEESLRPSTHSGQRQWLLWIGDGIVPDGVHLIDRRVESLGRTGVIVNATDNIVQVEWD